MPNVLINAKIFLAGQELTGQLNQVAVEYGAESLDATTFGNASRVRAGGLKTARASGRGFWNSGTCAIDEDMFVGVGVEDNVFSVFPHGPVEGSTSTGIGYAFRTSRARISFGGAIGDLTPFDFTVEGRGV